MASSDAATITAATPTLTLNNWVPPRNRDCMNGSDYWVWAWTRAPEGPTVIGGPAQSVSCLPSGWEPTETYAGTACPPHYTPACGDTGNGVVTCCPTVHPFTCNAATPASGNHAEVLRCRTTYGEKNTKLVTIVDMPGRTIAATTSMTHGPGQHLHALAVLYKTPAIMGSPTVTESHAQPTGAPSSTSDASSSGSGMSSGVTTGIGIGVGIGMAVVLAIGAAVFWMFWRRRKRTRHDDDDDTKETTGSAVPASEEQVPREMDSDTKTPVAIGIGPFAGAPSTTPPPSGPYPVVPGRHEMDVPHRHPELPAWSGRLG